jgi:hypothetical protein
VTSISFDASELRALAADLTKAGADIEAKALGVVTKGALNIKNQLRTEMLASRHFKGIARSISYDIHGAQMFGAGVIEAEIGPISDPGSGGNLANIAYFGSSRGGGTVPDPAGALDAELPNFMTALGEALGQSL